MSLAVYNFDFITERPKSSMLAALMWFDTTVCRFGLDEPEVLRDDFLMLRWNREEHQTVRYSAPPG